MCIGKYNPDIIIGTETHLENSVNSNALSAGLRSVEAPGQQCHRKVVNVMSISTYCKNITGIAYDSIQNVSECSCCTNSNNTSYLSYCMSTDLASSKVSDDIYVFKF